MPDIEGKFQRILPRVPTIQLPHVPSLPSMPFVGCFPGDGSTYVGKKWGNRPDFRMLDHIKEFKKHLEEEIITHTIGKLDNPARAAAFDVEIARVTAEIAEALDAFNEVVGGITDEINASLAIINDRKSELEAARGELLSIPASARSKVESHMIERYDEYFGELDAQADRLQSTISCLTAF